MTSQKTPTAEPVIVKTAKLLFFVLGYELASTTPSHLNVGQPQSHTRKAEATEEHLSSR